MNRMRLLALAMTVLFFLPVRAQEQKKTPEEILKPVREQFAPDDRMAVYDVTCVVKEGVAVVKGEVLDPKAKEATLKAFAAAGYEKTIDSIRVLPDPELGARTYGIVTVSATHMRAKPAEKAEMVSQALMGETARILKQRHGWYYVQLDLDHYLGWVDDAQMVRTDAAGYEKWKAAPKTIVTAYLTLLRSSPDAEADPVCDLVAADILENTGRNGGWFQVKLPDGRSGFLQEHAGQEYGAWKQSRSLTGENLEKTAKQFLGVPYLWGGTSPKGLDCSGFAKTVYRLNGVDLLRDADMQGDMGQPLTLDSTFSALKKGDLLFFGGKATKDRPERISHVGLYLGEMKFIHCSGMVKYNSFDPKSPLYSENLLKILVKAKRMIPGPPVQK